MNNNYTFSVIVPHYTIGDTDLLERAIKSIPDDDYIQILVIDNSPVCINDRLFDHRKNVRILYSDKKGGAGLARNVGLKHAEGRWLLFLDADDFFTENAFDILRKFMYSSYDIIFFNMTSCYSDTLEIATRHGTYSKIIDNYLLDKDEYGLRCSYPSPCAKMIRSEFVREKNILFDEVPASNDVMFSLKIGLAANSIYADSHVIYNATIRKGSLTNVISLRNIESRFSVIMRKNKMLREHGFKKDSSVMFYVVCSMKYGFIPFLRLFTRALISGDLFIGYDRWMKTLSRTIHDNESSYKTYR